MNDIQILTQLLKSGKISEDVYVAALNSMFKSPEQKEREELEREARKQVLKDMENDPVKYNFKTNEQVDLAVQNRIKSAEMRQRVDEYVEREEKRQEWEKINAGRKEALDNKIKILSTAGVYTKYTLDRNKDGYKIDELFNEQIKKDPNGTQWIVNQIGDPELSKWYDSLNKNFDYESIPEEPVEKQQSQEVPQPVETDADFNLSDEFDKTEFLRKEFSSLTDADFEFIRNTLGLASDVQITSDMFAEAQTKVMEEFNKSNDIPENSTVLDAEIMERIVNNNITKVSDLTEEEIEYVKKGLGISEGIDLTDGDLQKFISKKTNENIEEKRSTVKEIHSAAKSLISKAKDKLKKVGKSKVVGAVVAVAAGTAILFTGGAALGLTPLATAAIAVQGGAIGYGVSQYNKGKKL